WSQPSAAEQTLLNQFLARLRRFYAVDFCFGVLMSNGEKLAEVAVPEVGRGHLPQNFVRRCLDLVANSRAPITWNEVGGEFGFRSAVVAPITTPIGGSNGFLMLGHAVRRSYSPTELFLLQALAGELSWAARELVSKQQVQEEFAAVSHDIKNVLQLIVGNTALIQQDMIGALSRGQEKYFNNIDSNVQEILDRLNRIPTILSTDADSTEIAERSVVDIANALTDALSACQRVSRAREVDFEIVSVPKISGEICTDPVMFQRILHALLENAALAVRNQTVVIFLRRGAARLELAIKGSATNAVAEKLKSLFESAARIGAGRDDGAQAFVKIREYLEANGGDVYMRSRPGEASEFVVCVPIE
ncbi:MAG TPA: GAF domain-containing protein, partial [Candidatus Binatus sp.]|nr:GAF domain-containing protein [Candidatus Binatus sp.]